MTTPAGGAPTGAPAAAPTGSPGFQTSVSNVHLPELPEKRRKRRKGDETAGEATQRELTESFYEGSDAFSDFLLGMGLDQDF